MVVGKRYEILQHCMLRDDVTSEPCSPSNLWRKDAFHRVLTVKFGDRSVEK